MTICDTNIWYDLQNCPDAQKDSGYLMLTPLVAKEISNSPKLVNKFEMSQQACKNIFKYGNDIILETPLEYLLKLDNQIFVDTIAYQILSNEFEVLSRISDGGKIKEEKKIVLQQHIEKIRENLTTGTSDVQDILNQVRITIDDRRNHRKQNTIETTKELIKKVFIETPTNNQFKVSDHFNWSKIELFLYTFDMYIKELEVNTTMKIKDNDWIDIFNMLYVSPKDKYFTKDGTWLRIIKLAKMEKYLMIDCS
jgi:hypothetical protein